MVAKLKNRNRLVLGSPYPIFIWWEHQMINLYNDAYIPMLGSVHRDPAVNLRLMSGQTFGMWLGLKLKQS